MGLDISAYKNVRIVECDEPEYRFYNQGWKQSNMPHIDNKEIQIEFDEQFDFRAGSYGSYNVFRNIISETIHGISAEMFWKMSDKEMENKAFRWLIDFSDCEGYIGTDYCEILYNDFKEHGNKIKEACDNDTYKNLVDKWTHAFDIARNKGLVSFH